MSETTLRLNEGFAKHSQSIIYTRLYIDVLTSTSRPNFANIVVRATV